MKKKKSEIYTVREYYDCIIQFMKNGCLIEAKKWFKLLCNEDQIKFINSKQFYQSGFDEKQILFFNNLIKPRHRKR